MIQVGDVVSYEESPITFALGEVVLIFSHMTEALDTLPMFVIHKITDHDDAIYVVRAERQIRK